MTKYAVKYSDSMSEESLNALQEMLNITYITKLENLFFVEIEHPLELKVLDINPHIIEYREERKFKIAEED